MMAPARSAIARSPLTPIVWSAVAISAHDGSVFQAAGPDGSPNPMSAPGRCETAIAAASSAGRSAQNTSWKAAWSMYSSCPSLPSPDGIFGRPQVRPEQAVGGVSGQRLHRLALVRGEGGDVDQPDHIRGLGAGVGDHHAPVGVPDEQDRTRDLVDDGGEVGGIGRDTAQRVGRGHDGDAAPAVR